MVIVGFGQVYDINTARFIYSKASKRARKILDMI